MTIAQSSPPLTLPDHRQLPDSDGTFVKNFQEHPQSIILTTSIRPILDRLHPDGQYCIGQDSGIYWRLVDPPERGAEAPDWFYVPNVPPRLDGEIRRSYVLWKEFVAPLIAIEFVSGDGSEERDTTSPFESPEAKAGKFWVYEQAIRIPFYAIYEESNASVEVYELVAQHYQRVPPNDRGHYPIPPMGVELGILAKQEGDYTIPTLRWWDSDGHLLLDGEERAVLEKHRADQQQERAEQEQRRADQAQAQVELEREQAEQERERAEQERERADRLAAKLREFGIEPD